MSISRTERIRAAFGAAASGYEEHAAVQRTVAQTLAKLAAHQPMAPSPRILEIGCGTGLLTRELRALFPTGEMLITDLAPDMVRAVAFETALGARFEVMDGEHPPFERPYFDLIVSSLAFQWFADLPTAIARLYALLRPGGHLLFATMAQDSFNEWRTAHEVFGVQAGTPNYPSIEMLRDMLDKHADAFLFEEHYVQDFGGARGFHRHLKGIGATVPAEGRVPLSPALLRKIMHTFDADGGCATYHVAFCRVSRV
jgi:malonyl-CoA O-methyltransferase